LKNRMMFCSTPDFPFTLGVRPVHAFNLTDFL
jgi:hypothetical protein